MNVPLGLLPDAVLDRISCSLTTRDLAHVSVASRVLGRRLRALREERLQRGVNATMALLCAPGFAETRDRVRAEAAAASMLVTANGDGTASVVFTWPVLQPPPPLHRGRAATEAVAQGATDPAIERFVRGGLDRLLDMVTGPRAVVFVGHCNAGVAAALRAALT
jgi:hypothetical protein